MQAAVFVNTDKMKNIFPSPTTKKMSYRYLQYISAFCCEWQMMSTEGCVLKAPLVAGNGTQFVKQTTWKHLTAPFPKLKSLTSPF